MFFWGITDTRNTHAGPYLDLTEGTRKNSTDDSCFGFTLSVSDVQTLIRKGVMYWPSPGPGVP